VDIATVYDELMSLTSGGVKIEDISRSDPNRVERIIIANTALEDSKMINAPLGEDMWKDLTVKILSNETSGRALMINFPITMKDANQLMDRQDRTRAEDRKEREKNLSREFAAEKLKGDREERMQVREMEDRKHAREIEAKKAKKVSK
jgi:hypothetical protein